MEYGVLNKEKSCIVNLIQCLNDKFVTQQLRHY